MSASAWYGEPKLKAAVMDRLREDRRLDRITQGVYWDGEENRGCHLGCLTRMPERTHEAAERLFAIPQRIGWSLEAVFEGLPADRCDWWVIAATEAIPVGADLSLAYHRLAAWLLGPDSPSAVGNAHPHDAAAIAEVRNLHIAAASGETITAEQWSAVRSAQAASWSWSAWWSADSSAESAAAALRSAARSAAWSADSSGWAAAAAAAFEKIAAKSIEIFQSCPIVEGVECAECVSATMAHLNRVGGKELVRV